MLFDYDDRSEESILEYAKKLENKTYRELWDEFEKSSIKSYHNKYDEHSLAVAEKVVEYNPNNKSKGELGHFLERYYFGYKPNSEQKADFPKVGIELKQTCIDVKKNGEYTAGERLSITNISYENPIELDFYKSHVWEKIKLILLIHYLRDKSKERLDYKILFVNLFTPPVEDLNVIIDDYNKIIAKIKAGLAHELSESDTLYLGACTKGTTALKSLQPQYYGAKIPAKKRNFCFKRSYMNHVLHAYVLKNQVSYETIIKSESCLINKTFEEYIIDMINCNAGKTDMELCALYNRPYNNNKAQWSDLAYRMLGIKGNHAEEFIKAGIVVKAIRIEENSSIHENMSFPPFLFKDFVKEEWENSTVFKYFDETRFLFVVYKNIGECYEVLGAQMWNMPYKDLNTIVFKGWKSIQNKIKEGVKFKIVGDKVRNDLPKKSDNPIIHIRPHAKKSAYKLNNGYIKGDINKNANELPNGEWMTTQSFWINNTYILSQLKFK